MAAGIAYLSGGFVWDDGPLIVNRLVELEAAGMAGLWLAPATPEGPGAAYYRPVALSVMAIVGRAGPVALHALAAIAHGCSAALLVRLCQGLRWPLAAGLVFGVHPLAGEVLGWASALPDALAVTLGLLAAFYIRRPWSVVLLLAAALCKETALLIPLCFGVAGLIPKDWWRPWLAVLGIVLLLRELVGVQMGMEWMEKIHLAPSALGWSIGSLVWPVPLTAVRDILSIPKGAAWLGLPVLILLIAVCRGKRTPMIAIGLMLAAPILALPVVLDGYLAAERYLYPSLVGLGVWAAAVTAPPRVRWLTVAPLLCALGVHVLRAPAWSSNIDLFTAAVRVTPGSSYAWHLLGVSFGEAGESSAAAAAFHRAIQTGHPHPLDRTLRLRALVEAGRGHEALRWAESGPKEELTAETIAWWARAALMAGEVERAETLISMLKTPAGFDGPIWVRGVAHAVQAALSTPAPDPDVEAP